MGILNNRLRVIKNKKLPVKLPDPPGIDFTDQLDIGPWTDYGTVMSHGKATWQGILQGEIGITNSSSTYSVMGSFGAASCVIVTMYNPRTKTSALSHIDAICNLEQYIELMYFQLNKETITQLQVNLATHRIEDNKTLDCLKKIIQSKKDMKLETIYESTSLGIDSETGKILTNIHHSQLIHKGLEKIEYRVMLARLSSNLRGKLNFDGRKLPKIKNESSDQNAEKLKQNNEPQVAPPLIFSSQIPLKAEVKDAEVNNTNVECKNNALRDKEEKTKAPIL